MDNKINNNKYNGDDDDDDDYDYDEDIINYGKLNNNNNNNGLEYDEDEDEDDDDDNDEYDDIDDDDDEDVEDEEDEVMDIKTDEIDSKNNHKYNNFDDKLQSQQQQQQQQQAISPSSATSHLITTNDYEKLLKRLNTSNKEINSLRKLVRLLKTDIDNLKLESNNWEQKYNQAYIENKNLNLELKHLSVNNDELNKELNNLIASKLKLQHEIKRLKLELDALQREYSQIMSERDSVHKEIEALQEQLCKEKDKLKLASNANVNEIDLIRKELTNAMQERDKALNELRSVYERVGHNGTNEGETLNQATTNLYEKLFTPKEEKLIKENEKLQHDIKELQEEIEKAKKRRDLAFTERDKMLRERESIRALCDELRHQRDKAISELAEALRESDELKKQKQLAIKQIHLLEDNISMLEERLIALSQNNDNWRTFSVEINLDHHDANDLGVKFVLPHIDEKHNKTLSSKKLSHDAFSNKSLNEDQSYLNHINEINNEHDFVIVDTVSKNGIAYGKLREYDRILRINSVDMKNVNVSSINNIINTSNGVVKFIITRFISNDELNQSAHQGAQNQRHDMNSRSQTQNTLINRSTNLISIHKTTMSDLLLETGVYVAAVKPNSEANECLDIGDRLISINGIKLTNKSIMEIIQLTRDLHSKNEDFNLIILKTTPINLNDLNFEDSSQNHLQTASSLSPPTSQLQMNDTSTATRKRKNRISIGSETSSTYVRDRLSLTSSMFSNNRLNIDCLADSSSTISNQRVKQNHNTNNFNGHFERIFTSRDKLRPFCDNINNNSNTSCDDVSCTSKNSLRYQQMNYYQTRKQQQQQQHYYNNSNRHSNLDEDSAVRELDDLIEHIQKQQQIEDQMSEHERFNNKKSLRNKIKNKNESPISPSATLINRRYQQHQQQPPAAQQQSTGTWPKHYRREEDSCYQATLVSPSQTAHREITYLHSTVTGGHTNARKTIFNNEFFSISPSDYDKQQQQHHKTQQQSPDNQTTNDNSSILHRDFVASRNSKIIERIPLKKPLNVEEEIEMLEKANDIKSESENNETSEKNTSNDNEERDDDTECESSELSLKLPLNGEIRNINIEKNDDVLGINISESNTSGGVFVSKVIKNSLAYKAGMHVGDQLLEINGVNLRKAGYKEAAKILTDCGTHKNNVINLLVQYNPNKFITSTAAADSLTPVQTNVVVINTEPTTTLPSPARCVLLKRSLSQLGLKICGGNQTGIFIEEILSDCSLQTGDQILEWNNQDIRNYTLEKATYEIFKKTLSSNLNIKLNVQFNFKLYEQINRDEPDSFYLICLNDREKKCDNELKFKKFDILNVRNTLPSNSSDGYWKACLIYSTDTSIVRPSTGLIPSMNKFINELLEQQVDQQTQIINDEDMKSTTSLNSSTDTSASISSSTTSSTKLKKSLFFKNKQQQQQQPQKSPPPSPQSSIFIDLSAIIKSIANENELKHQQPLTYKLVECIDLNLKRPCIIIGALADIIIDQLIDLNNSTNEQTIKFKKLSRQQSPTKPTSDFIDLNEADSYDFINTNELKECLYKQNQYAFLNIKNFDSLNELKLKHKIYPIIIYLKFKSIKQILHINNTLASKGNLKKLNNKSAKELFQNTSKLEKEYKNYITNYCDLSTLQINETNGTLNSITAVATSIVSASSDINNSNSSIGSNSANSSSINTDIDLLRHHIYDLIKNIICLEQNKSIWIPASNTLNNNIFI